MKLLMLISLISVLSSTAFARQNIVLRCDTHVGSSCSNGGGCGSNDSHLNLILSDLRGTVNMDGYDFVVDASQDSNGTLSFSGTATSEFSFLQQISGTIDVSVMPVELKLDYVYHGVKDQSSYLCR